MASAYRRALETCAEHNDDLARGEEAAIRRRLNGFDEAPSTIRTIAFALISGGVFRGARSQHDVLKIGVEAIAAHCPANVEEVHMVGFSDQEVCILRDVAEDVLPA